MKGQHGEGGISSGLVGGTHPSQPIKKLGSTELFLFALLLDIGQKSHKSSTLYCLFDCTLLLRGQVGFLTIHDAAVRIDEILQEIDILVVDVLNVILREYVVIHIFVCLKWDVVWVYIIFRVINASASPSASVSFIWLRLRRASSPAAGSRAKLDPVSHDFGAVHLLSFLLP